MSKQGTIISVAEDNVNTLNIQTEVSESAHLVKKMRNAKTKEQENADRLAHAWKDEAER